MKITLKGHESFILREGWLTKGLQAIAENPKVFSKTFFNGADPLGVGTNMAKSIRYWMKASGLTEERSNHDVLLTSLGKIILEYDPYFEDLFSLWLIHIGIALNESLATSWYIFFNRMEMTSFTAEDMQHLIENDLYSHYGAESVSARSLGDDCSAIRNMYSGENDTTKDPEDKKTSPFSVLGLLSKRRNVYEKQHPDMDILSADLIMYLIADTLKEDGSLTIDQIVSGEKMPGRVFHLGRVTVNQYLDRLADRNYLTVNRTAGLDVVYPGPQMPSGEEIILQHYKGEHHE